MRIITTLSLCYFSLVAIAQNAYPSYEEVANYFTSIPTVTEYLEPFADGVRVTFEKRPEGWLVIQRSLDEEQSVTDLLWSYDTGFKRVPRPGPIDRPGNLLRNWSAWRYDLYPYFGYPSWELDVIDFLEKQEDISTEQLYLLARTYASYAGNLLSNKSGTSDPDKRFELKAAPNALNAEQLATYRGYMHKGLELYEKVIEEEPDFNTVVGNIETKIGTEYMTAFLDLLMYQNEEEAMKEIAKARFPAYDLTTFRNLLLNCKPNAILFTQGDVDTFAPLYLQAAEGLRRDVLVANIHLIRDPNYIDLLKRGVFDAPPLPLSLSSTEISDPRREVAVVVENEQGLSSMKTAEAIAWMRDDKNVQPFMGKERFTIPASAFELETKSGILSWSLPQNYFLLSGLVVMDVLNESKLDRPIYFSSQAHSVFGFDKNVEAVGIAVELTTKTSSTDFGTIDTERQFELLMNAYNYNGFQASLEGTSHETIGNFYIIAFNKLAAALNMEGEKRKSIEVLERFASIFPNEVLPYGIQHLSLAQTHLEVNDRSNAVAISRQLLQNVEQGLWPDDADYIKQQIFELAELWELDELYPLEPNEE